MTKPSLYTLREPLPRAEVLRQFAAMPSRLREALASVGEDRLLPKPAPGEWSAMEVLLHMRDAVIVYEARFRWIIFDDEPFLPNYNEDKWIAGAFDLPGDVPAILDETAAARSGLVRLLQRLPEEAWQRTGRHEVLGTVLLDDYVRHQLRHEEMHLEQLLTSLGPR